MNESFSFKAIGTSWHIAFNCHDAVKTESIKTIIRDRIELFEQNYSRFRGDSFVGQIAKEAGSYELPADAEEMIGLYRKLYEITEGKVTPLIGEVLVATGYDKDYSLMPQDAIPAAPSWDEVMDYKAPVLTTQRPLQLDFGGLGKGYIVDIVAALFREYGIRDYVINAGGDIAYNSVEKAPYQVVLEDPADVTMGIGEVMLVNKSIAGSSGNRRAWGKYHHIIDPDLTESPRHITAVWAVANTTLLADAMTTALFFSTPEILKKHFDFEYVIIYSDRSARFSDSFPGMLYS
jgi:thiamine biosynthesis lipoprotein